MKTSEKIIKVADEIEALLDENTIPTPNDSLCQRIKFLVGTLRGQDSYASEKAHDLAERATWFYSVRKHNKYSGGHETLWVDMRDDLLSRIRDRAETRKSEGD